MIMVAFTLFAFLTSVRQVDLLLMWLFCYMVTATLFRVYDVLLFTSLYYMCLGDGEYCVFGVSTIDIALKLTYYFVLVLAGIVVSIYRADIVQIITRAAFRIPNINPVEIWQGILILRPLIYFPFYYEVLCLIYYFKRFTFLPVLLFLYIFICAFFYTTKKEWYLFFKSFIIPRFNYLSTNPDEVRRALRLAQKNSDLTDLDDFPKYLSHYMEMSLYHYSYGANDLVKAGSLKHYWISNMKLHEHVDKILRTHVIYMKDVDYYVDMPQFLLDNDNVIVMYTVQPKNVSHCEEKCSYKYTFLQGNIMWFLANTAEQFKHTVWNYSANHISVQGKVLGMPWKNKAYEVHRIPVDGHRMYVVLSPIAKWYAFQPSYYGSEVKHIPLDIFRPNDDGFNRLSYMVDGQMYVSTNKIGEFTNATFTIDKDEMCRHLAETSSTLTTSAYRDKLKCTYDEAMISFMYHRKKKCQPLPVYVHTTGVLAYDFDTSFDVFGKKPLQEHCNAFDPNCPSPICNSLVNEKKSIEERVEKVRVADKKITPKMKKYIKEFVEFLIDEDSAHSLFMTSVDMVYERQNTPTQRLILDRSHHLESTSIVQAFPKKEAYGGYKAPRNISTINPVDKREYSRVIYAFENVMKKQPWYAFSKTPLQISERLAYCLKTAQFAANSDFSKFDGHVCNILRAVEEAALRRAFVTEEVEVVTNLHKKQMNLTGYGAMGTKYETKNSRLSGSPETSCFNSLGNAFFAYVGYREAGCTPDEAWDKLALFGGDDGILPDLEEKIIYRAADMVGQEATVKIVQRGDMGIKFLARVYGPNIWEGDINSCCDLPRQMSKLHTAVRIRADVPMKTKFLEKMRAYSLTDFNTPILGDIVRKAMELNDGQFLFDERCRPMLSWFHTLNKDAQYKNLFDEWMLDYIRNEYDDFDMEGLNKFLGTCKTVEDIMKTPCFRPLTVPPIKVDVAVNHELVEGVKELFEDKPDSPDTVMSDVKDIEDLNKVITPKEVKVEVFDKKIPSLVAGPPLNNDGRLGAPLSVEKNGKRTKWSFEEYKAHALLKRSDFISDDVWMRMKPEERESVRLARKGKSSK